MEGADNPNEHVAVIIVGVVALIGFLVSYFCTLPS